MQERIAHILDAVKHYALTKADIIPYMAGGGIQAEKYMRDADVPIPGGLTVNDWATIAIAISVVTYKGVMIYIDLRRDKREQQQENRKQHRFNGENDLK